MFLFTPARLRALTWLGAFVSLVLMTEGTCTWVLWSDGDSVAQLSEVRACELARVASFTTEGDCVVVERAERAMRARVQPVGDEPVDVCFLKAGRWFAVDHGVRIACPSAPPSERVASWSQEFRLEQRWQETISGQRELAERTRFKSTLALLVEQHKALDVLACPTDLPKLNVPALDAALLVGGRSWHFVTDDDLESELSPSPRRRWNPKALPSLIVLVDLPDKRLPEGQHPGWARGTLAVVDWVQGKVLCKAAVNVVQPENAYRDLSRPDVLMPDFKDRVAEGLRSELARMTGGSLTLQPTW